MKYLIENAAESLSFDPLVQLYDETRTVDTERFPEAIDFLSQRFPPDQYPRIIEPGIGTGRIAIPLAMHGYQICGVDISTAMLQVLAQRLKAQETPLSITFQPGDATALPYSPATFDLAIVVHLFYFIPNWRQAMNELLRVVKDNGPIILMHTGYGMEVPWLLERYKAISATHGYCTEHIGARSTRDVLEYAKSLGCHIEEIRDRWNWIAQIPVHQALSHLQARAYSCTTRVPESLHTAIMTTLTQDARSHFGSLDERARVPNEISLVLISSANL